MSNEQNQELNPVVRGGSPSHRNHTSININKKKDWTIGLIMLSIVVFSWVTSSFLISLIFEDDSYRKPFFITYLNTSSFTLYLLPTLKNIVLNYYKFGSFQIMEELRHEEEEEEGNNDNDDEDRFGGYRRSRYTEDEDNVLLDIESEITIVTDNNHQSNSILSGTKSSNYKPLSLNETIKLAAQFCILWFLANLANNASLSYTSVTSQTILSSTSSFFTLLIGYLYHVEKFSHVKVWASVVSFLGIVLLTRSDIVATTNSISDKNALIIILYGNILALVSAVLYGLYTTLLKLKIKHENRINMKIFLGFVGVFTLIFLWPSLIIFNYLNIEKFEFPTGQKVLLIILVNGIITFIGDYCWAKAMLLTSPLTVTVGISTTIPFAMFGDIVIFHTKSLSLVYLLGAILIGGSFFILNKEESEEHTTSNDI